MGERSGAMGSGRMFAEEWLMRSQIVRSSGVPSTRGEAGGRSHKGVCKVHYDCRNDRGRRL